MRACPPRVLKSAQRSFDVAFRSSLERIVTAYGPGFCDWQWKLATLPFAFGGLGVYSAGDVLNYAFHASRLQPNGLHTKLLRRTDIVSPGPIFDYALSVFYTSIETDLLSNLSEIAAPKFMKRMVDIYFTRVTKNAESTFSLSPRQMALWTSQRVDHTSDWLRTFHIFGLGKIMNWIFMETMLYRMYGLLRDEGLDVCVDLTGSSPLMQTRMVDSIPGRAVIDVAQRKRGVDAVTLLKRIRKFSTTQDVGLMIRFSNLVIRANRGMVASDDETVDSRLLVLGYYI
nr:hypothetical protein [Tanacetum cinerariifolium]